MSTIINLQLIVWLACSIHIILIHLQRKKLQRKLWILLENHFFFLNVETTFRYIFPSNNLQCWPHGNPQIFAQSQARIRLTIRNDLI